jgi:phosphoglycerate kinase
VGVFDLASGPRQIRDRGPASRAAAALAHQLRRDIIFADDCVGPAAVAAVGAMENGDILCLENTRF